MKEVKEKGFKITEEKVIFITKDNNGKIRWLEKGRLASEGNRASGLVHILNEHALHFNRKGIPANLIPALIKKAVEDAKIVGKSGKDRDVYETTMNGKIVHIAITISDNGYIVGAHPVSIKKGKNKMRKLQLLLEYGCYPVWSFDEDGVLDWNDFPEDNQPGEHLMIMPMN